MMDLHAEIQELSETTRLLKKLENKYDRKGKKRLISNLTKAQQSLDVLKETLQKNLTAGLEEMQRYPSDESEEDFEKDMETGEDESEE